MIRSPLALKNERLVETFQRHGFGWHRYLGLQKNK